MTGSRSRVVFNPLPQDDPEQRKPDITRAASQLGWAPTVPLRDGLAQTVAYFDRMLSQRVPTHVAASVPIQSGARLLASGFAATRGLA